MGGVGVGFMRDEKFFSFFSETGRVGVGFITDGKDGCGFYERREGWVWVL